MPNTKLLIKLRDLHGELSAINDDLNSAEQVDDEAIDALGEITGETIQDTIIDQIFRRFCIGK